MARSWNTKEIEAALRSGPEGRHRVAPSLYLRLERGEDGLAVRAHWQFRYQIAGRPRWMGLGGVGDVTLAQARAMAEQNRVLVRGGADPLALRQQRAREAATAARVATMPTFRVAAAQHIAAHEAGWKSDKHAAQWASTLEAYAYPVVGDLPVDQVTSDHVIEILRPIWTTTPETAGRVRGRIEAVLDAAKVRRWRSGENPACWKGNLALLLPRKAAVAEVQHHPALGWQHMPAFWTALAERSGTAAAALRFLILTAARSGEVRGATWAEIDVDQRRWTIPSKRMKGKREHRVPLSDAAMAVLAEARGDGGPDADALLFPARGGSALSDMALTALLRRMAWADADGRTITAHGMRSTFRDWSGEATHHRQEVIEHALAHRLKDKAEAAYQRGDLLAKRAVLMSDWASFCTKPTSDNVVALRAEVVG